MTKSALSVLIAPNSMKSILISHTYTLQAFNTKCNSAFLGEFLAICFAVAQKQCGKKPCTVVHMFVHNKFVQNSDKEAWNKKFKAAMLGKHSFEGIH